MAGWAHACLRSLGLAADHSKSAEQLEAERCAPRLASRPLPQASSILDGALGPARCSQIGLVLAFRGHTANTAGQRDVLVLV